MSANNPPGGAEGIGQKLDTARAFCLFLAITLMTLSRKRVGFNTVKPTWVTIMTTIMLGLAALAGSNGIPFFHPVTPAAPKIASTLFCLFALAYGAAGMYQRRNRWNEYTRGEVWFANSVGISFLEGLKLPEFLTAHRRLYRYVEPILWLFTGLLISLVSPSLGAWICLSAIALKITEDAWYEGSINQSVVIIDGIAAARAQATVMNHANNGNQASNGKQKSLSPKDTVGVVIGVSPEITAGIERMRQFEQQAQQVPSRPPTRTPVEEPVSQALRLGG